MQLFSAYAHSQSSSDFLSSFLEQIFPTPPVLLCLGTDRVLADSLGPLVASNLRAQNYPNFIYGGLHAPVTRQNAEFACDYIRTMHPCEPVLLIDSMATKNQCRLGHTIITNNYCGAINRLNLSANFYLYGITSLFNNSAFQNARLNTIYTLSDCIILALKKFVKNTKKIQINSF